MNFNQISKLAIAYLCSLHAATIDTCCRQYSVRKIAIIYLYLSLSTSVKMISLAGYNQLQFHLHK